MLIDEIRKALSGDCVSFVELSRLDGFKGELAMYLKGDENAILWPMCSREAVEAINEIMNEDEYELAAVSPMRYAADGLMIGGMPILRNKANNLKEPHWFPVVFNKKVTDKKRKKVGKNDWRYLFGARYED